MSNKPPLNSHRRIDHLKARAFDSGFTNEEAKQFGKLSKTATWEALLETYGIPKPVVDNVDGKLQSLTQVIGLTMLRFRCAISLPKTQPIF